MAGKLTPTSFAVLGLLAAVPASSYALAKEMGSKVRFLWPRALSKVYEEPKKLTELGLATARTEPVGRRARTVYSITAAGRRALRAWLAEPGAGPVFEFEGGLQLYFGDQATKEDLLRTVRAVDDWFAELSATGGPMAQAFLAGGDPTGGRGPQASLVFAFQTEVYAAVLRWRDWAEAELASWPDDGPPRRVNTEPFERGLALMASRAGLTPRRP